MVNSPPPEPLRLKTILVPSGEKDASPSTSGLLVSRVWPEPSAFIEYTSKLPSRPLEKTILVPSGDHIAFSSSKLLLVSGVMPEPSPFIEKISVEAPGPEKLSKAILPVRPTKAPPEADGTKLSAATAP